MKKNIFTFALVCLHKGPSIDDVGVASVTAFQEMRPGTGFETGDFVKDKLRGGGVPTVDRPTNNRDYYY